MAAGGGAGGDRKREIVTVELLLKGYMSKPPPLTLADIPSPQERLLDEHVFEFKSATGSISSSSSLSGMSMNTRRWWRRWKLERRRWRRGAGAR